MTQRNLSLEQKLTDSKYQNPLQKVGGNYSIITDHNVTLPHFQWLSQKSKNIPPVGLQNTECSHHLDTHLFLERVYSTKVCR